MSAAAGKLGSMVAVLVVYGINAGYSSSTRQGLIFLLFATFMALGAIYAWAYLPDVQRAVYDGPDGGGGGRGRGRRLETRNLEELGEGYMRAKQEGQVIGFLEKWRDLRGSIRKRNRRDGDGTVRLGSVGASTAGPVEVEGSGVA